MIDREVFVLAFTQLNQFVTNDPQVIVDSEAEGPEESRAVSARRS